MTVTVATFRTAFPEFASGNYPDATIQYNLDFAARLIDPQRWGALYNDGLLLLAAHNLTLSTSATNATGSNLGTPVGVVTSKSVGGVSKSIDARIGLNDRAGIYAVTSYGRRYFDLFDMMGAGGIQL